RRRGGGAAQAVQSRSGADRLGTGPRVDYASGRDEGVVGGGRSVGRSKDVSSHCEGANHQLAIARQLPFARPPDRPFHSASTSRVPSLRRYTRDMRSAPLFLVGITLALGCSGDTTS